jgi:hypothetical protein
MEVVVRIDVKQLVIAIGYAALSVSLIGCAAAPAAIQQSSISETVGHNRSSIVPNGASRLSERQQLWGEPGSRAAAAGALLAKKMFAADH